MSNDATTAGNSEQPKKPLLPDVPVPPELQRLDPKVFRSAQSYFLQAAFHSGPLPSPEQLEGYERVSPGAAKSIIEMAQAEQKTRHYCMRAQIDGVKRGQICAMVAFFLAMATAAWLAYCGSPASAATLGGGAITVFGGAFILERHFKAKKSRAEKPKFEVRSPGNKKRSR